MKIKMSKKDWRSFFSFILLFLIISQSGLIKYLALSAIIILAFAIRKKMVISYNIIFLHSVIYIALGLILCAINGTLSFDSIKQTLIYLCSGLYAICFFSIYGKKESTKLVDIQFIALCICYLILYARYFTLKTFYHESCMYAYIFGVYGLVYFCQRRYKFMLFAIIFMLFDHKRITNAAFIIAFIALVFLIIFEKEKFQKTINFVISIVLFVVPILWVLFCSNGFLAYLFATLQINTMGRLEGTGAWNIAKNFYDFSPFYIGKGIGFILNWLEKANIYHFSNLHNDFLTGYIELGFVGYIIWILSFQTIPRQIFKESKLRSNIICIIIGFMFVNLLTDNIYLYVTFLCPFYLILLSIMFGEDRSYYTKIFNKNLKKQGES